MSPCTVRLSGRRIASAAAVAACLLASFGVARAESAAALGSSARQIAADMAAQKSAGRFDAAAQQRAIERLGKLVLGFIEVSDRAANAGAEGRERDALRAAYEAISAPLEQIYNQNIGALEHMAKQIMDADGDLEALYETGPFKEAQLVASQSLYFLNWLHFYGARLYDGARRKELLETAQRGFSEFAVGDRRTDLLTESLLGRGLCHLELGNMEFAVHDLQAVANDAQTSPERRSKAHLALLDGYVRNGNTAEALKLSDQLLRDAGGRGEDNLVRFLRIRALLAGTKNAGAGEAERYRQQALALMDQLRRAGAGWEEKVAALAATGIDHPEKWADNAANPFAKWEVAKLLVQKGDYKQAMPLLESFVTSSDAAMRHHQGEAHYFLGLAQFQAAQYDKAAENLDAALTEEKPSYGADAAYMRFKAREAIAAKSPSPESGPQYEQAVRSYLAQYPDHRSAFEAHFRLGELLQAQRRFADALVEYGKVQGDPAFELRAQFAALQCEFELLEAADAHTGQTQRSELLRDIGVRLQAFDKQAADYEKRKAPTDVGLKQMRGKMAVMKAFSATLQPQPDYRAVVDAVEGFEHKFPDQQDLLPQVARLRLTALPRLGRFADSEAEAKAHGSILLASYGAPALEELAVSFVREGARRNRQGDAAANQAAQQVALRLYEQLASDSDGRSKTKLTLARLYENSGDDHKAESLYAEVLQSDGNSLAALRGLGRIAEAEKRLPEALTRWQQLTKLARPGDAPWYEGTYQVARLTQAMGDKQGACDQLEQTKPALPGLSDADLRKRFDDLYKQTCR